jgi:ABC-type Fe3+-siderophore transport system permease subunit
MNKDGMTDKEEKSGYYRIRDGKRRILQKIIVGAAFIGFGLTMGVHAYWHATDPYMLGVAAGSMLLGMYLSWDAGNDLDQQVVELGRGLFGKAA